MGLDDPKFEVEGRFFPNSLQAFTFATIQADRMNRPVEVHVYDNTHRLVREHFPKVLRHKSTWHATAHPPGVAAPRRIAANGHRYASFQEAANA
jgi:hypothetical protein